MIPTIYYIILSQAIECYSDSITDVYGLETGERKLKRYFDSVKVFRYEDSLHITEVQPLLNYILSSQGTGNVNDIIVGEKVSEFARGINEIFGKNSCFDVIKDAGIFIATNTATQHFSH